MRATIATLLALATLAHGTDYVARIVGGVEVDRRTLPTSIGNASIQAPGRLTADALAQGWRDVVPVADRTAVKSSTWASNAVQWVESVTRWTPAELDQQAADAAAAQAAAEATRLATPIKFDQTIQAAGVEAKATDGHFYGIKVDPVDGDVFAVQRESTRKTDAEDLAATESNLNVRAAHRATMQAIKTDLDQVEVALDQIDVSATSTYATNIAACTGATKTAFQETRRLLVAVKAAAKNLRQACEKLRREVR